LRRFLAERLASHMIPSQFVMLESLPLLANGKVDRRALPDPPRTRPALAGAFVPPGSPVEETLERIWSELLGLDEIGVHDHFLELGGDSLLASRLMARVVEAFGVDVSVRSLFESPTIRG